MFQTIQICKSSASSKQQRLIRVIKESLKPSKIKLTRKQKFSAKMITPN